MKTHFHLHSPHAPPAGLSQLGIMDVAGLTDAVDAMALVSVPERCGSNKENIHRLALAQGANDPYKVCVHVKVGWSM